MSDIIKETERRKKISINNAKFWSGKQRDESTRMKISKKLKGKKLSEETKKKLKGRIPWNKNLKGYHIHTEESKKKISDFHKGKQYNLGRKLSPLQKEIASITMKNNWKEGKIKSKSAWNKGKSTKELGKARPKVKIKEYECFECKKLFINWEIFKCVFCSRECAARFQMKTNNIANSPEVKKKISEVKKGIRTVWGEKHGNWLGGVSFEPYGIEFNKELKKQIRIKFENKCFECNFSEEKLGYKLSIHHIDYDKKNNNEYNLIPLCKGCHTQTNYERSDWMDYFKDKLKI